MARRRAPSTAARRSAKIRKVRRDSPGLTNRQAVGKAFGILRSEADKMSKRKGR